MTEADIVHENGIHWVSAEKTKDNKPFYRVWECGITHSRLRDTIGPMPNALERAIAQCDRRAKG